MNLLFGALLASTTILAYSFSIEATSTESPTRSISHHGSSCIATNLDCHPTLFKFHGRSNLSRNIPQTFQHATLLRAGSNRDDRPPGFLRATFPFFPWTRLPNLLTYARCVAIPLFVLLFYTPGPLEQALSRYGHIATGTLFAFASFTDWLDGFLARRWNVSTPFGAFLDPVADKLMVSTALLLLSGRYGAKVALPAAVILAREIAVSALREWMAQKGMRDVVKVGYQGKVKTALTMVALTILLFVPQSKLGSDVVAAELIQLLNTGVSMLYMSAIITVTSGSVYFRAAAPILMGENKGS